MEARGTVDWVDDLTGVLRYEEEDRGLRSVSYSSVTRSLRLPRLASGAELISCVESELSRPCENAKVNRPDPYPSAIESGLEANVAMHEGLRASDDFKAQVRRLERVTYALVEIIQASWLQSSRHRPILDGLLLYTSTDDTLESVVAIQDLVSVGVHNAARRELRYLLESSVKHVYVDQQLPNLQTHNRSDRLAYLASDVPRSSIEMVKDVAVVFSKPTDLVNYQADVKSLWSQMSGYVHPSEVQTSERLRRAARGAYIGFEDVKALRKIIDDIVKAYDILGVMWLMGAGPSAAGDILTAFEKPGWAFAKTKWLPSMSRYYDYKTERKAKL